MAGRGGARRTVRHPRSQPPGRRFRSRSWSRRDWPAFRRSDCEDNFWERMFTSGEPALADNSPVQSIAINYPPREISFRLDGVELDCAVLCGVADRRFHFQECAGDSGMKLRVIAHEHGPAQSAPLLLLIVCARPALPPAQRSLRRPGRGICRPVVFLDALRRLSLFLLRVGHLAVSAAVCDCFGAAKPTARRRSSAW